MKEHEKDAEKEREGGEVKERKGRGGGGQGTIHPPLETCWDELHASVAIKT